MKNKIPWTIIKSKLRNTISKEDNTLLTSWLTKEANQEVYNSISSLWNSVQEQTENYSPDVEVAWKRLQKEIRLDSRVESIVSKKKITPISTWSRFAAACIILVVLNVSVFCYFNSWNSDEILTFTHSTIDGKSKIILPDNSAVWINKHTTISYNANYGKTNRDLNLSGEAFFEVVSNDKIPFKTLLDGVEIKVHGTKFNVEARNDLDDVIISLVEGSISLKTKSLVTYLKPEEIGVYSKKTKSLKVESGDVYLNHLWASQELKFCENNLGEICKSLAEWFDITIDVDPVIASEHQYSFTLRNETLKEILEIMAQINPMSYQFIDKCTLEIKPITNLQKHFAYD